MTVAATAANRRPGSRQASSPLVTRESVRAAHAEAAPWPYGELDVAQLRAGGWRPTPIHDVVLKVHQRCNLACDYCYVYTQVDQSWRDRPAVMPDDVLSAAIAGLARHVVQNGLKDV